MTLQVGSLEKEKGPKPMPAAVGVADMKRAIKSAYRLKKMVELDQSVSKMLQRGQGHALSPLTSKFRLTFGVDGQLTAFKSCSILTPTIVFAGGLDAQVAPRSSFVDAGYTGSLRLVFAKYLWE